MKMERRWMAWVLAESSRQGAPLPWQRGTRRRPAAVRDPASTSAASS